MIYSENMQIVELDSFDTAFPVPPGQEDKAKRRFMTLFAPADDQARTGGTSIVRKVSSFTGETFALKQLLAADLPRAGVREGTPQSARLTAGREAAFFEEYKNQLLVSRLRGFPRVYGLGAIGADPVIVMEWVEGVSVRELMRDARESCQAVSTDAIVALGRAVLDALEGAARLDATLVHRDISPGNIMVRTERRGLEEQLASLDFDICLVDFGTSATADPLADAPDPSFTMSEQAWRYGTPEYAAPEMLTRDLPRIDELRKSPAVDVFALCSVLYELYAGRTPWQVAEHRDVSPYLLKTETPPTTLDVRESGDEPLAAAIMAGLVPAQDERPTLRELARQLDAVAAARGMTGARDERDIPLGEGAPAADAGAHLEVATSAQGGRRAAEDAPEQAGGGTRISRRTFLVGAAIVAVGALAGGGAIASRLGAPGIDFSGYPRATAPYAGAPLYPAQHLSNSSWVLRDAASALEVPLPAPGREPGVPHGGVLRIYDAAARRYGFMSPADDGSGALEAAWLLLPRYADAGDFSDALDDAGSRLAAVKPETGGAWGYIDLAGESAIAPAFAAAGRFANGFAAVRLSRGGLWGLADTQGKVVLDLQFAGLGACSAEGLLPARTADAAAWGFIDTGGAWQVAPAFAQARGFTQGLAACQRDADGLWGFIQPDGAWHIEARFACALPFADGVAPAQDADSLLWGLVGQDGKWQVKPQFLALGESLEGLFPAHGSPAGVYDIYGADADAWQEYLETASDEAFGYGYIDPHGTWAITPAYGNTFLASK